MQKDVEKQFITDLHAHTRYSAVNEHVTYSPAELVKEAASRGLDGIALTGHDTFAGVEEALVAGEEHGIVVTPGVEVTSRRVVSKKGVQLPHILGLFPIREALEFERTGAKIPSLRRTGLVIDWIHEHGGVAIAVHPTVRGNFISLGYRQLSGKFAKKLDGVETRTRCWLPNEKLDALVQRFGLAAIGSSDPHDLAHVGVAATKIYGLPDRFDSDDVLEAIRQGRTEAVTLRPAVGSHMTEKPVASYLRRRSTNSKAKRKRAKRVL